MSGVDTCPVLAIQWSTQVHCWSNTREGGGHTNINRTPARSVPLVKQGGGNTDLNIMQAEIMQGGREGGREGGILNIFDNCSRLYFSGFMLDISPHSLTSYCNLVGINL